MTDQTAFEAWHGAHGALMAKMKDGRYANSIIESQWMAWQAAIKQERERSIIWCGCGDAITAHDPGCCGNCLAMKYEPIRSRSSVSEG